MTACPAVVRISAHLAARSAPVCLAATVKAKRNQQRRLSLGATLATPQACPECLACLLLHVCRYQGFTFKDCAIGVDMTAGIDRQGKNLADARVGYRD